MRRCCGFVLALTVGLVTLATFVERGAANPSARERDAALPLAIMSEDEFFRLPTFVMRCPSHAHGTPEEACKKLKKILAARDPGRPATMWICRHKQIETLRRFGPMVDEIGVNPFAAEGMVGPRRGETIWPGWNHTIINRVREIRRITEGKRLLAAVDVGGESLWFPQRRASLEEIRWQVLAAIGANYQGIIWRGRPADGFVSEGIKRLEELILAHADELGRARPVGWVAEASAQPASALASNGTLFIVLLNPLYMKPLPCRGGVELPLASKPRTVHLTIRPSACLRIESGRTLAGHPVSVTEDGGVWHVDWTFRGGGEVLILPVSGRTASTAPAVDPHEQSERRKR